MHLETIPGGVEPRQQIPDDSLPPHLYSHGSAVVGTVQHASAALKTALFVIVMSIGAANLRADNVAEG